MINYKEQIAKQIGNLVEMPDNEIEGFIEIPNNTENGDYAFPCFKLSKTLKKSPQIIAQELKEKIQIDTEIFNKIEVVGGYVNFFINTNSLTKQVLQEIDQKREKYGAEEQKTKI